MVYFVCSNCQETLKLKVLVTHGYRCGGALLSCVDCSADFTPAAARCHTTCISEAEKYEKTLFKGGKGGKAGKVDPQEVWTQAVATAAAATSVPRMKHMLDRLLPYTNVPRKAPKFVNFARNSLGVRDDKGA